MVKGQRTKGNTKPSSSRRTAELLATSGSANEAVNTFVGFSSLATNAGEDEDLSIDSELKVVFKKMSKKDCITKVKALQEFQQLVRDKSEADVRSVLSQWPRVYNKLAIDNDWRVREATHRAQGQLFAKVGRNIAPYLKQLMPIWLTSQFDPYSPAATAAIQAFDFAFPATKKSDVLVFTKESVINYINDILLNQTIETLGELSATAVENKSKYNRLVSNCLQGLSSLVTALPSDALTECQNSLQELVNNNNFWKFSKSRDSSIKSSWFNLMSSFAQNIPNLFITNANKICALTLGGLNEKDLLVAPSVWNCALLCLITIQESWNHVNFKKAFYPQFRDILCKGGRGSASTLFPNLLPILSRIPHESTEEFIKFHKEFYVFLREGLAMCGQKCQNESNAIITAFMECLRYSITNTSVEDIEQRIQFQTHLIQNELISLVNDSISADNCLFKTSLFADLAQLWIYLRKDEKYENLIQLISAELTKTCLMRVNENDFNSFARISRLFLSLFSDTIAVKKEKKIRFRRESDEDIRKSFQNLKLNELVADETAVSVLNRITKHLIDSYHCDHHKHHCLQLLHHLLTIQTTDTIPPLMAALNVDNSNEFWTNYLKHWFKDQSLCLPSDEKSKQTQTLIDIIVVLMALCQEKYHKSIVLNEICSLNDPYIIETLFSKIISSKDKYLLEWLKSESAGQSIVAQTSQIIHDSITSSDVSIQRDLDVLWKLMSLCFVDNSFDRIYIEKVIDNFRITLQNSCLSVTNKQYLVDFICRLATQLFASYELCTSLTSARDLLLTLFTINCRFDDQNTQILNAWKSGVTNIVKSNGAYLSEDGIITRLALQIRSRLQSNITSLENAEQVFKCGFEFLNTIYETINGSETGDNDDSAILSDPNIALILDLMFLTNSEWNELETKCDKSVVHYEWLNSDSLFEPQMCQMIESDSFDTNGIPFVFSAVSTLLLIERLVECHSPNALSDDMSRAIVTQLNHIFVADSYVSLKSKTDKTNCFVKIHSLLSQSLTKILESNELSVKIGQKLLEKSIDSNSTQSQAFGYFIEHFMDDNEELQYELSFENLNYNKIITFQKYFSHLNQNRLKEILNQSLNAFVCCERFGQFEDGIAKLAVLQSCLKHIKPDSDSLTISEAVNTVMEAFCGIKSTNLEMFYYKDDIEANSELQFHCLIIQTFNAVVDKYSDKLTQTHWDLILCSTTSWIINIIRQKESLSHSLPLNICATKVFSLVQTISHTFRERIENDSSGRYPQSLAEEWLEFHAKNIYNIIIPFYIEICEKQLNFYEEILLKFVSKSVTSSPISVINDLLSNLQKRESLSVQEFNKVYDYLYLPQEKENCFNIFCPLVVNKDLSIALSSHQLILKFIPFLLKDVIQPEVVDREEDESLLSPPKTLLSLLQQTDHIVDSMLSEFRIGDCCCAVEPNTDSFTYTFAYLLLWFQIIDIFGTLCDETRSQFSAFLRQSAYLSRLLENLFRLMPLSATTVQTLDLLDTNATKLSFLSIDESLNSGHIQYLSCNLYYLILRRMPASVRQWWNNCDRKTADVVNRYTSNHFSTVLCAQELEAVQRADITQFNNMVVKSRPSAREVLAIYTIEEITIELLIRLPVNHPLGPVVIDSGKRIGVQNTQWRQWLLQLTTFLTHQNGSILDGLILWKQNIDKRFQGVDECMICFYVLHSSTFQLPKQQCKYCKKRYHSYCLYKWFRTSANSTCPLCRNLF